MITKDNFKRIDNDINGNPRYVCHYSWFLSEKDKTELPGYEQYDRALKNAKKLLDAKKYRSKKFGGGIVISSYNLEDDCDIINDWMESENEKFEQEQQENNLDLCLRLFDDTLVL